MCESIRFFHGRGAILNLEAEDIDIAGICILAPENLRIDFLNRQSEFLHIVNDSGENGGWSLLVNPVTTAKFYIHFLKRAIKRWLLELDVIIMHVLTTDFYFIERKEDAIFSIWN